MTRVIVTGHRNILNPDDELWWEMRRWLKAVEAGEAGTGMARGADQMFASACQVQGVPWVAFIPFPEFYRRWPQREWYWYHETVNMAREIKTTFDGAYPGPWVYYRRDLEMVEWCAGAEHCRALAIYDGRPEGGTRLTMELCRKHGIDVDIIEPRRYA